MMLNFNPDPRIKLFLAAVFSSLGVIYSRLLPLSLLFICSSVCALVMNDKYFSLIKRIRKLLVVAIFIAIIQSLSLRGGHTILSVGEFSLVTDLGLYRSVAFLLRMGIIITTSIMLASSSSRDLIQGMIQLKIPYEIAFMVSIGVRFFPMFRDEFTDVVNALKLRGVNFKKIKVTDKFRVYSYLLMPIIINSLKRAKDLSVAMTARGYRAYPKRTSWRILKLKTSDYVILCTSVLFVLMFIFAVSA